MSRITRIARHSKAINKLGYAAAAVALGVSSLAAGTGTASGARSRAMHLSSAQHPALSGLGVAPRLDGLSSPDAIASDGTHVWVANHTTSTVTELNALTGGLVPGGLLSDPS